MDKYAKFFPVGHGLTYGLKLENKNILFDICKEIPELITFFKGNTIDILIISHFHHDHVASLEWLLSNFTINEIYIPYISEEERIILEFIYANKGKSFSTTYNTLIERLNTTDRNKDSNHIVRTYAKVIIKEWIINIHQHKGDTSKIKKIVANLNKIGIYTNDDVANYFKAAKSKDIIRKEYTKIIKDLNFTSLFMVHGPLFDSNYTTKYSGFNFSTLAKEVSIKNDKNYTLISGDCNFKKNKAIINTYKEKLGFCLVPHHSSIKSWDNFICKSFIDIAWIVTISKISTRPYGSVVSDILSNHQKLYICDNTNTFEQVFKTHK